MMKIKNKSGIIVRHIVNNIVLGQMSRLNVDAVYRSFVYARSAYFSACARSCSRK